VICLGDNDAIRKLAACDLLGEALQLLGTQDRDVRVLPTARYFFSNRNNRQYIEDSCRAATLARIDAFLGVAPVCQLAVEPLDLAALNVRGIDAGERIFFAVTDLNCRIVTGDKTCLRALSDAARKGGRVATVHARWQGRIVWFDQILLTLAQNQNELVEKMWQGCACDGALLDIFVNGSQTPVSHVIQVLESRVAQVHRQTNGLLLNLKS